jgi:hypothetical protein
MKLPGTSRILSSFAILLCLTIVSAVSTAPQNSTPQNTAPQGSETATWNVPLRSNQTRPSSVTATNDCFREHQFQIQPDHLAFMRLQGPASFAVAPKGQKIVPVEFDAHGLASGRYDAVLTVRCMDCKGERGCTEDHKDLHVFLTVFPNWTEIFPEQKGSVKQNPALRWVNISPDQKP